MRSDHPSRSSAVTPNEATQASKSQAGNPVAPICTHGRQLTICAVCAPIADERYRAAVVRPPAQPGQLGIELHVETLQLDVSRPWIGGGLLGSPSAAVNTLAAGLTDNMQELRAIDRARVASKQLREALQILNGPTNLDDLSRVECLLHEALRAVEGSDGQPAIDVDAGEPL